MDQLARELFDRHRVAWAVAVGASVRAEDRWFSEIGTAGRLSSEAGATPVVPGTWFDLASLTKPVLALTVARLARAGRLSLGDRLGGLVPEAKGTETADAPLELLLAHRAGLLGHVALFEPLMRGRIVSRRELLAKAAAARMPEARGAFPREGFAPRYSDLGYLLLGEAAGRAAEDALDGAIETHVTKPLGLSDAIASARRASARDASFARRVAATETVAWRGGTLRGVVHDENAWAVSGDGVAGHAGLFGTLEGVLKLGRALVDVWHGRLGSFLSPDELLPLVRPRPGGTLLAGFDGKSETGSSAGIRFAPSSFGHLGFTGTSIWCDVERGIVGVLLTNRVHPTREHDAIRRARPSAYDRIADWAEQVRQRGPIGPRSGTLAPAWWRTRAACG